MTADLSTRPCIPCTSEMPPLTPREIEPMKILLGEGWEVVEHHHLVKEFPFRDFREGLDFTNKVGELAEREGHHPDIHLAWGKVRIEIWTHKMDGLSDSDFILAAKIDKL